MNARRAEVIRDCARLLEDDPKHRAVAEAIQKRVPAHVRARIAARLRASADKIERGEE